MKLMGDCFGLEACGSPAAYPRCQMTLRESKELNRQEVKPQWSLQNRPMVVTSKPANGRGRDRVVLALYLLVGQAHFGTPTARAAFEDMTVME